MLQRAMSLLSHYIYLTYRLPYIVLQGVEDHPSIRLLTHYLTTTMQADGWLCELKGYLILITFS